MNKRDMAQIKKRLSPTKRYQSKLVVMFVDSDGTEISRRSLPVVKITHEAAEKYMSFFKKLFSGIQGQNIVQVDFATEQVKNYKEGPYGLLYELRETGLDDDKLIDEFMDKMQSWMIAEYRVQDKTPEELLKENAHVVLLMYDQFDVVSHTGEDEERKKNAIFGYLLCVVCEVKREKSIMVWSDKEKQFCARSGEWTIGAPEIGFMFPSFIQGSADIYSAQMWTKDKGDSHPSFTNMFFGMEFPLSSEEQGNAINAILQSTLKEECTLEVIAGINEHMNNLMREHDEDDENAIPQVTASDMSRMLVDLGVTKEKAQDFEDEYHAVFGDRAMIPAVNVVSPNEFKIVTPSVKVQVLDPDKSDLITVKTINGMPYITILADGTVEVNGVMVNV